MNQEEEVYKELYLNHPDIYFYDKAGGIYHDWEEFKAFYRQSKSPIALPDNPPTQMSDVLRESAFFLDDDKDVSLVFNARYCPPFWHHLKFVKIMYVLNGTFLLNTKHDKTIQLKAGNFVVVPPELEQSVFSHHDEDMVVNIFLRASTLERAFSSLLLESRELSGFFWKVLYGKDESSIIWFQNGPDPCLDRFVLDMYDEVENPQKGGNFFLVSYVMAFLAYALYHHQDRMTSIRDTQLRHDKFPAIIQYIRGNYSTITLPALAEHFQKSEEYLSRYIRQETGYTLTHLLREFRIKKAATMLRDSELSIEEIMFEVGYTDASYFYKVFKEHFHMTPHQYRKHEKIISL